MGKSLKIFQPVAQKPKPVPKQGLYEVHPIFKDNIRQPEKRKK